MQHAHFQKPKSIRLIYGLLLCGLLICGLAPIAEADVSSSPQWSEAKKIWRTLNGTPLDPRAEVATGIVDHLQQGNRVEAARLAIANPGSSFATALVRNLVVPLAGREPNISEPIGDFVLTWMMNVHQDRPLDELFLGSVRFASNNVLEYGRHLRESDRFAKTRIIADSDLNASAIRNFGQRYIGDPEYRLGSLTSIQYAHAMFDGGTNRRPIKKIAEDFLCLDIASLKSFQIDDLFVGRDVARFPGGDPNEYLDNCRGCHAGMDATRIAFSGYDIVANRVFWRELPRAKMNNNPRNFRHGYEVRGDEWEHTGYLPLMPDEVGSTFQGPKKIIEGLLEAPRFYECLTERIHQALCPGRSLARPTQLQIAAHLDRSRSLRSTFVKTALEVCVQ